MNKYPRTQVGRVFSFRNETDWEVQLNGRGSNDLVYLTDFHSAALIWYLGQEVLLWLVSKYLGQEVLLWLVSKSVFI